AGPSLLSRQVRDQGRVVGGPRRDLNHDDAHPRREELLRVGPLVGMSTAAAAVFDDQVHLLDPLRPDDGIVLPEGGHFHVLFIHALLAVDHGAGTAVAVLLTLVWDIAQR